MVDRGGALVAANPSAERILGMEAERILAPPAATRHGRSWRGTAHRSRRTTPDASHGPHRRAQSACRSGLRRPDGSIRWLSVSTRAVEPDRDGPFTVVVSFTDVTEEREASGRWSARTPSSGSSPTSPPTISQSRFGWSRAICNSSPALPRASGQGRRRVHPLRGRRRGANARADRGPAGLLARRPGRGAPSAWSSTASAPTSCARSPRRWSRRARRSRSATCPP